MQLDVGRAAITRGTQQEPATRNVATWAKTNNPNPHEARPFGATGHRPGSPQSYGPQDRPSQATVQRLVNLAPLGGYYVGAPAMCNDAHRFLRWAREWRPR